MQATDPLFDSLCKRASLFIRNMERGEGGLVDSAMVALTRCVGRCAGLLYENKNNLADASFFLIFQELELLGHPIGPPRGDAE